MHAQRIILLDMFCICLNFGVCANHSVDLNVLVNSIVRSRHFVANELGFEFGLGFEFRIQNSTTKNRQTINNAAHSNDLLFFCSLSSFPSSKQAIRFYSGRAKECVYTVLA